MWGLKKILGKFGSKFDPVLHTFTYLKTDFFLITSIISPWTIWPLYINYMPKKTPKIFIQKYYSKNCQLYYSKPLYFFLRLTWCQTKPKDSLLTHWHTPNIKNCPHSPLIGTHVTEKMKLFYKSPWQRQVLFTLSMQIFYLSIVQRRKRNRRTKKNKMTQGNLQWSYEKGS